MSKKMIQAFHDTEQNMDTCSRVRDAYALGSIGFERLAYLYGNDKIFYFNKLFFTGFIQLILPRKFRCFTKIFWSELNLWFKQRCQIHAFFAPILSAGRDISFFGLPLMPGSLMVMFNVAILGVLQYNYGKLIAKQLVIGGIITGQPSDDMIIWSQFIGGVIEFSIGTYEFFSNDCKFSI